MPRPKGSKNKKKVIVETVSVDFNVEVEELKKEQSILLSEIESLNSQMDDLKNGLKEKKTSLKENEKRLAFVVLEQERAEKEKAEAARKEQISTVLSALLEKGLSTEDILAKLES